MSPSAPGVGGRALRVAVVGAGMAGLMAGRVLAARGHAPRLFDKGRAPGGRMASKRLGDRGHADHGAQFFTIRDARIASERDRWLAEGLIAPWRPSVGTLDPESRPLGDAGDRYVALDRMRALPARLAADLFVEKGASVRGIERSGDGWALALDGERREGFDVVLAAVPAPQARPLLAPHALSLAEALDRVGYAPCLTAVVRFAGPVPTACDVLTSDRGPVAWAARDTSKPGRGDGEVWVLHGSPAWSRQNLEADPDGSARGLLDAFGRALPEPLPAAERVLGHRWRYARVERALEEACLFDPALGLGACGDWALGPRVEAALCSGMAAAERIDAAPAPGG